MRRGRGDATTAAEPAPWSIAGAALRNGETTPRRPLALAEDRRASDGRERTPGPLAESHSGRIEVALVLVTDWVLLGLLCVTARSLTLTAVTAVTAVLVWHARGLYTHRITLSVLDDLPSIAVGVLVGLAPGVAAALIVPTGVVGGTATLRTAAAILVVVALGRTASYALILKLRRDGRVTYPTVLVGAGPASADLADRIVTHPESGLHILGVVSNQVGRSAGFPLLGGSADLSAIVASRHVSNLVIGYGGISSSDLVDVLRTADQANLEIHVVPRLFELATRQRSDDHIWGLPLVRLRAPSNRQLAWRAKRGFDIVGALTALVLVAPLMAVVALLVRYRLGPGIVFRQTRIGRHGEPFQLMKFRSMPVIDGSTPWTVPQEELGWVGRTIRRYSLDELPQLVNVLRGDMSLVGPRPERPEFVDEFLTAVPCYSHRHRVAVGMTGLAAVNGLRGDTSIAERCRFDNWYIDHWSLWLDVKIMVRTLSAVLRGTGS